MLPSEQYARLLQRVPAVWDNAFEVNASGDTALITAIPTTKPQDQATSASLHSYSTPVDD